MKYNRINVGGFAWQPYLEYEVDGIKRQTVTLWYDFHYPDHAGYAGPVCFSRRCQRVLESRLAAAMERRTNSSRPGCSSSTS